MRPVPLTLLLCACTAPACASAADTGVWPPRVGFADDITLTATGNIAWDHVDFSGEPRLGDGDGLRRREFGATLKKAGVWDAMVYYDFESHTWLDVYLRVETSALFGRDLGKLRAGYIKVPVGLEGATGSRAVSLMEMSTPTQAFYQGRRTGLEWTFEQPRYLLQAGGYAGTDLHGDHPGQTVAGRAAWTPRKGDGDVLHLGVSASRENPEGWTDGRGAAHAADARLQARPGAGLTPVRLVDTGSLAPVAHIHRTGLEGVWIHGPVSLQGELMHADISRGDGLRDYRADGGYVTASWLLTGESRPYAAGSLSNPKPSRARGAVELLARYSRIDLDDAGIDGGRQHDWTVGANWYLGPYVKLQANYVRVDATRAGVRSRPGLVEVRVQVHF